MTTDTELVERVARAIHAHEWEGQPKPDNFSTDRAYWESAAIAALQASGIDELRRRLIDAENALFLPIESDASYELQGAREDLKRFDPKDGGVIANTVGRVIGQLERARAALQPNG